MMHDTLNQRAYTLYTQRHTLRNKNPTFYSQFPEGTAVIVEQQSITVLYHDQKMLSIDHQGSIESPLSDSGLDHLLHTLEDILQPA